MPVDSYKFLPRLIAAFYEMVEVKNELPIPWTPLSRPLSESKFGLVTSGGLFHIGIEPPFDLERERSHPTWGDPTCRFIPSSIQQQEIGVSHLHINTRWVESDFNILLPINRFQELIDQGLVGALAEIHFSFMGYQGYPPDASAWREVYGPRAANRFKSEGVHCVLLTPS
jgi:D-proline reductase (dithiol) PrdB